MELSFGKALAIALFKRLAEAKALNDASLARLQEGNARLQEANETMERVAEIAERNNQIVAEYKADGGPEKLDTFQIIRPSERGET